MKTVNPSRRKILAGVAAAGVVAALPVAGAPAHPDAELICLGADFDHLHADCLLVRKELQPIHEAFEDAVKKFKGLQFGQNREEWWVDLREKMGVEAAIKRENGALERADDVAAQVRAIPARTFAGFAIKLKVLAFDCGFSFSFDAPDEEIEWPEACFLDLIREAESHPAAI
jgi:hypothetical protein